jgi:sulfhydrogenase subunit delta
MKKPKVAFFDFASCEGCQLQLTYLGRDFLTLLEYVELVEFREIMEEKTDQRIDIAFIEGSFTREADRQRLKEIRKRSNIVVAYSTCSATGNVYAIRNNRDKERVKEEVYGSKKDMPHLDTNQKAEPISSVIQVDYTLPQCPVNLAEFKKLLMDLVHQKAPYLPDYPVCVECKYYEYVCRYQKGEWCLGPVTRAGCGAFCIGHNIPCEGCRGYVSNANLKSMEMNLIEAGMAKELAQIKLRMWAGFDYDRLTEKTGRKE